MTPFEKRQLLYVVALAFVLRLVVFLATPVIGTDGYNFFAAARTLASGQLYTLQTFHPLYPLFYALASLITGEYEIAGKGVSLISGVLTIFPLYFISRSIFGHNAAIFSTFFLAVNPTHIRLSADVMSETTYVLFVVISLWLARETVLRQSYVLCALLALSVGLGYATRAEGLGLLAIIIPWLFIAIRNKVRGGLLMAVSYPLVFVFVLAIIVFPYLVFIHKQLGFWHISTQLPALLTTKHVESLVPDREIYRKKRGTDTLKKTEIAKLSSWKQRGQYYMIVLYVCNEFVKVLYYPVLPFLLIGFFTIRQPQKGTKPESPTNVLSNIKCVLIKTLSYLGMVRPRLVYSASNGEILILIFILAYFAIFCYFAYVNYYISGRYMLPLATLSLVWGGAGFQYTSEYISSTIPSRQQSSTLSNSRAILALIALVLLVSLPKGLKVKRTYELGQKMAGQWIRERSFDKIPCIMGLEKVAFYAQGKWTSIATYNYDSIIWHCNKYGVNYLAIYNDAPFEKPETLAQIKNGEDFVFVKEWIDRVGRQEKHLLLYEYLGRPPTKWPP